MFKRVVSSEFWTDDKVVNNFSPQDKLFMLYLLTNPHSRVLGIYHINKRLMAFETGFNLEGINELLDRFENQYQMVKYSEATGEIAIKNYLKHSIVKGGKPFENLLKKDIKDVKDKELLKYILKYIELDNDVPVTVSKIVPVIKESISNNNKMEIEMEMEMEMESNPMIREVTAPCNPANRKVTGHESCTNREVTGSESLFSFFEQEIGRPLSPLECETFKGWTEEHPEELVKYAISKAVLSGNRSFRYINGILESWAAEGIKSVYEADEESRRFKESRRKDDAPVAGSFRGNQTNYEDDLYEF